MTDDHAEIIRSLEVELLDLLDGDCDDPKRVAKALVGSGWRRTEAPDDYYTVTMMVDSDPLAEISRSVRAPDAATAGERAGSQVRAMLRPGHRIFDIHVHRVEGA